MLSVTCRSFSWAYASTIIKRILYQSAIGGSSVIARRAIMLICYAGFYCASLQWRHYGRDGVSNHQRYDCLLYRLFTRRSKKHQSSASLAFARGIHRWPVNSSHKRPITRKMFPFDDVIINPKRCICLSHLRHLSPRLIADPFTRYCRLPCYSPRAVGALNWYRIYLWYPRYGHPFRIIFLLWGESIEHRWIPSPWASNVEPWCFPLLLTAQTVEQLVDMPMIWAPWRSCDVTVVSLAMMSSEL